MNPPAYEFIPELCAVDFKIISKDVTNQVYSSTNHEVTGPYVRLQVFQKVNVLIKVEESQPGLRKLSITLLELHNADTSTDQIGLVDNELKNTCLINNEPSNENESKNYGTDPSVINPVVLADNKSISSKIKSDDKYIVSTEDLKVNSLAAEINEKKILKRKLNDPTRKRIHDTSSNNLFVDDTSVSKQKKMKRSKDVEANFGGDKDSTMNNFSPSPSPIGNEAVKVKTNKIIRVKKRPKLRQFKI